MTVDDKDRCTCKPSRENPSVIGACACPEHGMKALTRERDEARQQLTLQRVVGVERIARVLAEHIVGVTVRADEPIDVCRFHRELAQAIVGWQSA